MSCDDRFSAKEACVRYAEDSAEHASSVESESFGRAFHTGDDAGRGFSMPLFKSKRPLRRGGESSVESAAAFPRQDPADERECRGERADTEGSPLGSTPKLGVYVPRHKRSGCCVRSSLRHAVRSSCVASDCSEVGGGGVSTNSSTLFVGAKRTNYGKLHEARKGLTAMYMSARSRQKQNASNALAIQTLYSSCPHAVKKSVNGKVHKNRSTRNRNSADNEDNIRRENSIGRRTRSCPARVRTQSSENSDTGYLRSASRLVPEPSTFTRTSSSVVFIESSLRSHLNEGRQYKLAVQSAKMGRYAMTVKELLANPYSFDCEEFDDDEEEEEESEEEEELVEIDDGNIEQDEDEGLCEC